MSVLLTYALSTVPQLLQASPVPPQGSSPATYNAGTLTLLVANNTGAAVTLTFLELAIPIGDLATDLTAADNASAPYLTATADPNWTADPNNPLLTTATATLRFTPNDGHAQLREGGSLRFDFAVQRLNTAVGTVTLTLTEGSSGNPIQSLKVSKFPAEWNSVSFSADTPILQAEGPATLSWDGPAGATYTLEYFDYAQGTKINVLDLSNSEALWKSNQLSQTTVFYLTVHYRAPNGNDCVTTFDQTVTVVLSPTINAFTGKVTQNTLGFQLILSWATTQADSISISGVPDRLNASGSVPFTPTTLNPLLPTYTLTATNTESGESTSKKLIASWGVGGKPVQVAGALAIAITPDGSRALVVNTGNGKSVTALAFAADGTLTTTGTVTVGRPGDVDVDPIAIAITPDGSRALVVNTLDDSVTALALAADGTLTTTGTVTVTRPGALTMGPRDIVMTPDGSRALVVNSNDNSVTALALAADGTLTTTGTVPLGSDAGAIAMTPDGSRALVANTHYTHVTVLSLAIDGTLTSTGTVPLGSIPYAIAMTPDGSRALVLSVPTAEFTNNEIGIVTALALAADGTITSTGSVVIPGMSEAGISEVDLHPIVITPDGNRALAVGTTNGTVTALSLGVGGDLTITDTVSVGVDPIAIIITPDGSQALVMNKSGDPAVLAFGADGTLTVTGTILVGQENRVDFIAMTPDGSRALVADSYLGTVTALVLGAGGLAAHP